MELALCPEQASLHRPSNVEIPMDSPEYASIYQMTMRVWGLQCRPSKHCPAGKPVSLERRHLDMLRQNYVVSKKSDGVRFLLLLHRVHGEPVSCMWSLSGHMYEITVTGADVYFDGTVVDGELIWENNRMVFEIFDCIALCGVSYSTHAYADRMRRAGECVLDLDLLDEEQHEALASFARGGSDDVSFLQEPPIFATVPHANANDMNLRLKPFASVSSTLSLWQSCEDNVDGLIFTPNMRGRTGRVPINTARWVFKWKPYQTIDLTFEPAHRALLALAGEELVPLDMDRFHVDFDNVLFECLSSPTVVECRCELHDDGVHLFPMRHRNDKTVPNTRATVESTVACLADAISIQELQVACTTK